MHIGVAAYTTGDSPVNTPDTLALIAISIGVLRC